MSSIEEIVRILEVVKDGLLVPELSNEDRNRLERVYMNNLSLAHYFRVEVREYEVFYKNYLLYGKREKRR